MTARKRVRKAGGDAPRVSYAGLARSKTLVQGGRIKILQLAGKYPDAFPEFNILYLASSARPRFLEEWIKISNKAGIKIVWNQNGVAYPAWAGNDVERINQGLRFGITSADKVMYQSEYCRVSSEKFLGIPRGSWSILHNPVDVSFFRPVEEPLSEKPLRLLVMGSHTGSYRVLRAIEAAAILYKGGLEVSLCIGGRLMWENGMKETLGEIERFNAYRFVKLAGKFTAAEALALYQNSHVLIHLQYQDACPTTVLEAMACGLPVVASRSGGTPELMTDQCGVLLPVDTGWEKISVPDAGSVAQAVNTVRENREKMRIEARKRTVEKFSLEAWLNAHEKVFESLLNG